MKKIYFLFVALALVSCSPFGSDSQFVKLDPSVSGMDFENRIVETDSLNVLVYEYFYNGAGVAAADFDNDGLVDLYFTANQGADKVYKNLGGLKFEDMSNTAGLTWRGEWKTGVTVVDINADGLADIYVSLSGNVGYPEMRKNKLYINKGNFQFEERAADYRLDCKGYTTQSAFFDYDKDGDLDAYIMNHNVRDFNRFDVEAIHFMRDEFAGDKLLRNDDGHFVDVSKEAGIKGNPIGFGLGINVSDLNGDGWPDIYISNDYLEGDYLYINQKDGTFVDEVAQRTDQTSYFSMGNDVADVNNDALPDIFTADMLPEDNSRQKLLYGPDKYEGYMSLLQNGIHPEVMRNMLHLNEGNGHFVEIGQLAGVSNSDWSWAPLLADFDNDGLKDMFISNGYLRDYTNNDFVKFYAESRSHGKDNMLEIIDRMPSTLLSNYIFRNIDGLTFENMQEAWGISEKNITNGAIYADLDNDGDLDLIESNLNSPSAIYENTAIVHTQNNYIAFQWDLPDAQLFNTKITLYANGQKQYVDYSPNHGFQSAYRGPVHFGVGPVNSVEKVEIVYPDGVQQVLKNLPVNTIRKVKKVESEAEPAASPEPLLVLGEELHIAHAQQAMNDFSKQILLNWMYSYQGPCLAVADVNGDGLDDFYLGGGKGAPGQMMLSAGKGLYKPSNEKLMKQWELSTDIEAQFFDADGDGDLDLYVVSGGYEYLANDLLLQNKLYINDGKGNFTKNDEAFPPDLFADSGLAVFDADNDGDQDVFVGGFVVPGNYPENNPSRFYKNEGGRFVRDESELFKNLGLVTDAVATDFNGDGLKDLVVVGEWAGIQLIKNTGSAFVLEEQEISHSRGLWQSVVAADLDGDGDEDLLVGNLGLNSQLRASDNQPLRLFTADYDQNGRQDPILALYNFGKSYPFYSRDEMLDQLFPLRKKYDSYAAYADETIEQLLENFPDSKAEISEVNELKTLYLENQNGKFVKRALPNQIQAAPVYAFWVGDLDQDGDMDLVVGGNNLHARVRLGNIYGNHGQVYLNDGAGNFEFLPPSKSGLRVMGEVRAIKRVNGQLFFARNSDSLLDYSFGGKLVQ
ncbi:VCBS repeat-containing protein [Marinilongibacter aquaticus]|uniref:VCBS repeat-containing protein n=1 Tax=Marinilongibacter aquaticus TaxID=2975157 RepID=UPI0021BDC3F1|nr:VCBS repeat-containing protein [Marinilongibacter aquaticus]UBM60897.1 VCBS repeat-containing protein [Marinilongibacter aquaticus]